MDPNEEYRQEQNTTEQGADVSPAGWQAGPVPDGPQTGWQPPTPKERASAGMALAALLLGVLSILCSCTVYGSLLTGGLAVILALLSKGKRPRMSGQAKAGVATGCVGVILAVYMLISSLHTVMTDPDAHRMFNEMFEQYYGESFEDAWQDTFGGQLPE